MCIRDRIHIEYTDVLFRALYVLAYVGIECVRSHTVYAITIVVRCIQSLIKPRDYTEVNTFLFIVGNVSYLLADLRIRSISWSHLKKMLPLMRLWARKLFLGS